MLGLEETLKLGPIVRGTLTVRVRPPPVAVTVTLYEPDETEFGIDIARAELTVPSAERVTLAGVSVAVMPEGAAAESDRVPLNPPVLVAVIVVEAESPFTLTEAGLAEMVKSGIRTTRVIVTLWVRTGRLPLKAVTVTEYVPATLPELIARLVEACPIDESR